MKLLTPAEVGERLGLTPEAVTYRCRQGYFPNAQKLGVFGFWVIPEEDLQHTAPKHKGRGRVRLTRPEYEARGLTVIEHYKRKPPILQCQSCGETWRSWDWRCANGCNCDFPEPDEVAANAKLREARKAKGLSQKTLAEAVGVTTAAVSAWELVGTIPEDVEVARSVVRVLGVDVWGKIVPGRYGERQASAKLTVEDVRNIRRAAAEGQSYRDLARHYGVCDQTIAKVVRRASWKHVD